MLVFYGIIAAIVLTLTGGMAYRQLFRSGLYSERERIQNQRRVIVPGPRGNIYDRDGKVLVGNRARFSVVLNLAELRGELRGEFGKVLRNFRALPKEDRPTADQLERIARTAVAQRYLDQVNGILARQEKVRSRDLDRHFAQTLLLPFILLDDLAPDEYARLIERLPVNSPLQVYASSTRHYPFGSAAAHVLGYVGVDNDPEAEEFPGDDLLTFKMKGAFGRDGLEKKFDDTLQGQAGGAIYRVDPAGYKVDLPVEKRLPVQGRNLTISLDIELQQAAEAAMAGKVGAAVALDVATGEVLVMASAPTYDLNEFVPRLGAETARAIQESGGWLNRATQGQYPPGSTFKIITAIAGLRSGTIDADTTHVVCPGFLMVGNRRFPCHLHAGHGDRDVAGAIRDSCNVFFYKNGLEMGPELIAAEAARFGFNHPTGIELPSEFRNPRVASPAWKRENMKERWFPGDTANIAIGQGDTLISPLQAACMVASFARGEIETKPTLLHDPKRPRQRTEKIGLTPHDYDTLVKGMAMGYQFGTGKLARVDGLTAGTKTGTAQKGKIELAWMVAFAPLENPRIALAVMLEGQEGEDYFGSVNASPVIKAVLEKFKEKSEREPPATFQVGAP
ncbi:MAG: peptidoglycan glycosyltransferase [Opitutus sp.]|nr:peptidoglycan glycosyltransferase [Opitutus sp.]